MPEEVQADIKLHQCVFGYADGHRLLASSLPLSTEAATLLLLLSDLGPGLALSDLESYWTGVPLVDARYYALMQTWPAPEVPRPGCVWTHVLLISFADIARFTDFTRLTDHSRRPTVLGVYDSYSQPIRLEVTEPFDTNTRPVRTEDALRVVRALYARKSTGRLASRPRALDDTIFAVWSQQWPRLRRAFSFRTATTELDVLTGLTNSTLNFNLRVVLGTSPDQGALDSAATPEPWESAAVSDLRKVQPTEFRRFLWRYGSDIRRGQERFRFLSELYISTRVNHLTDGPLDDILSRVSHNLPVPEDGRLLKEDLLAFTTNQYSLLPSTDPLDTLAFFARHSDTKGLPIPSSVLFHSVAGLWANRPDDVLSVAHLLAQRESQFAEMLLKPLSSVIELRRLLQGTADRPMLRRRLLEANPLLLDTELAPKLNLFILERAFNQSQCRGTLGFAPPHRSSQVFFNLGRKAHDQMYLLFQLNCRSIG